MRALIFDVDGLMIDSERVLAECVVDAVSAMGGSVTIDDFAHLFGTTEADAEWARLLPIWCGREIDLAAFEGELTPLVRPLVDELPLLPGVVELIAEAQARGWRLAVATGHSPSQLEPRLTRLEVWGHFDAVVTSSEVGRGKPAPDIFLEASRRLDVAPEACIVLEDSPSGCEAALAAGMRVVACPSVVTARCEFPAGVHRVQSLEDLDLDHLAILSVAADD